MNLFKLIILITLFFTIAYAKGVTAGTVIKNVAILSYTSDDVNYTKLSNEVEDTIAQLIDLKLEWIDESAVIVASGDEAKVLRFRLTNLGNAYDNFAFSMVQQENSEFSLKNAQLIKDVDGNGVFDANIDAPVASIGLNANQSVMLFVVADIPEIESISTGYATEVISAHSVNSNQFSSSDDTAIPVVTSHAQVSAEGSYQAINYTIKTAKEAVVENQVGTHIAVRGATITYKINLSMEGIGEIKDIVVQDSIPEGTVYLTGTLMLDGRSLSDGIDSDAGQYDANKISVKIASMKQTSTVKPQHTVSFKVKIL
ncbi:MAG: hypothetical protein K0U38_00995, partial [Epsilonproteobacteria bacterium]|nr:hypothetical protein [Campylobacterota bacterium]